ncbi:MAG: thiamine pyrophosphate-binding protein [Candidatus Tectimicrobiota bacterium]
MAEVFGYELVARALKNEGADTMFFLMGGPMLGAQEACRKVGIRMIDVRHEQAAAMMANAYARLTGKAGLCSTASGPAATNLLTGMAHALTDAAPIIALGGASPVHQFHSEAFQEVDQFSMLRPAAKWAAQAMNPQRIPEYINIAYRQALTGRMGPAYLDLPGDVLYARVQAEDVVWPQPARTRHRTLGDPGLVQEAVHILARAQRPVIVSGSGILWSDASAELTQFVNETGIPFYTTPQGRGVVPEDHPRCFLSARNMAFREADACLFLGTRFNYVISHGQAPRFNAAAKIIQVNIDPAEIGKGRPVDVGIVGDAKAVLGQMLALVRGKFEPGKDTPWIAALREQDVKGQARLEPFMHSDAEPIHPLRLCKEVRDFLPRDAILVVDGQEILNYGRQSIPTYTPGHRLNSGPFGTMGVGVPFGLGAKAAKPDKAVLVLHGDGSFGMNAMEMDTAVRHNLPVVTVISLNGGWTADPEGSKIGRQLGYQRYEKMMDAFGGHGEYVEKPAHIRPALERAFASGKAAIVNVKTDYRAQATTMRFTDYTT